MKAAFFIKNYTNCKELYRVYVLLNEAAAFKSIKEMYDYLDNYNGEARGEYLNNNVSRTDGFTSLDNAKLLVLKIKEHIATWTAWPEDAADTLDHVIKGFVEEICTVHHEVVEW